MIKIGEMIPKCTLRTMVDSQVVQIDSEAIFAQKKVVLFGVPGAFTPGCTKTHLPGYVDAFDAIRAQGFDTVACVSVNDAWVMHAWGESTGATNKVLMLADGSAAFARLLGLESDLSQVGMGLRCKRFSMVVTNGVVEQLNVDERYIETTSAAATCQL
mgnify:CR=1 FL=1